MQPSPSDDPVTAPAADPVLLENGSIQLTGTYLLVGRSRLPLSSIQKAWAVHDPPRPWPVLLVALLAMGAVVPLILGWLSTAGPARAPMNLLLAVTAATAYASVIWLVVSTDSYWLVISTPNGERKVFSSGDRELVGRWVSVLHPGR